MRFRSKPPKKTLFSDTRFWRSRWAESREGANFPSDSIASGGALSEDNLTHRKGSSYISQRDGNCVSCGASSGVEIPPWFHQLARDCRVSLKENFRLNNVVKSVKCPLHGH
ncbi:hypothetical protein Y032_0118g755 [Ancylostoma ceylanicum]|uniref:Uncharacterized protein n=1 Tax=Ancylostoma ceylanicum TaxID=53326 RepID=A0A016TBP9_9BILA|nr:hypothetical protein Y032_0118g755 [Ancylostoma ceylanicum]